MSSLSKLTHLLLTFGLTMLLAYQIFTLLGIYEKERGYITRDIQNSLLLADYSETVARLQSMRTNKQQGQMENVWNFGNDGRIKQEVKIRFNDIKKPNIYFYGITPYPVKLKKIEDFEAFNTTSFLGIHTGIDYLVPINFLQVDSLFQQALQAKGLKLCYRLSVVRISRTNAAQADKQKDENLITYFDETPPQIEKTLYATGEKLVVPYEASQMQRKAPLWVSSSADAVLYPFDMSGHYAYLLEMPDLTWLILGRMLNMIAFSVLTFVIIAILIWRLIANHRQLVEVKEREKAFLQNMTHELKTPIAVSLAAIEALEDTDYPATADKRNHYYAVLREKQEELFDKISRILTASIDRADMPDTPAVNLRETCAPLLKDLRMRLPEQGQLSTTIPADIHVPMLKEDLVRVLSNLLDNAIKYSDGSPQIALTAQQLDRRIYIKISDKGCGIPKAALPHIFDRFYRVQQGHIQSSPGTGLGLSDTKETLHRYGAEINVDSTVGKGTTFTIII